MVLFRLLFVVVLLLSSLCVAAQFDGEAIAWKSIDVPDFSEDFVLDTFDRKRCIIFGGMPDAKNGRGPFMRYDLEQGTREYLPVAGFAFGDSLRPLGMDFRKVNHQQYLLVALWPTRKYDKKTFKKRIGLFVLESDTLKFKRVWERHSSIIEPNDVCLLPDGSFYWTNHVDPKITSFYKAYGGRFAAGSIGYCNGGDELKIVKDSLYAPNGILWSRGVLYVNMAGHKGLHLFRTRGNGELTQRLGGFDLEDVPKYRIPDNLHLIKKDGRWYLYTAVHKGRVRAILGCARMYKIEVSDMAIDVEQEVQLIERTSKRKAFRQGSTMVVIDGKMVVTGIHRKRAWIGTVQTPK